MDSFLWTGFKCPKTAEPLRGDSLLLTSYFQGNSGTHLIEPESTLEPPSGFESGIPVFII